MPQAEKKAATPPAGADTKTKTEAADKPKVVRTNFSAMYPEDAALKVLVEENPKKKGSKSAARFEGYTGAATVGDALSKGVTYQDIAYDVGRAFIQIG
jgi:hypothetical protein